jgi:hypothetical protein
MSVRFEWDPNAAEKLTREMIRNLTPKFQQAVATVTCPDHGKSPRVSAGRDDWQIEGCCERAAKLGQEAISRVLNT